MKRIHYETHSSIKLSEKNFGGILSPKSVRRTLVIGLIYGLRANKQFDIAFFSEKNFGGILSPKSVRRTLVIGLIYGLRANKQFDIAFFVFWTLPGPVGHLDILIFRPG